LFSKKKINAINVITAIAMLGFGVGGFAMVVVLSTFNGFENIVEATINNYDPDIKITVKGKKTFIYNDDLKSKVEQETAVINVSKSLEEKVVIKYDQHQEIAKIKGVDSDFEASKLDRKSVV